MKPKKKKNSQELKGEQAMMKTKKSKSKNRLAELKIGKLIFSKISMEEVQGRAIEAPIYLKDMTTLVYFGFEPIPSSAIKTGKNKNKLREWQLAYIKNSAREKI